MPFSTRTAIRCSVPAGLAALALSPAVAQAGPRVERASARAFSLQDSGRWAASSAAIDAIQRLPGAKGASVTEVVESANRTARPLGGSGASAVKGVVAGFRWNTGDDDTGKWYPQGISGSSDAVADSVWGRHRILLASWYSKLSGSANAGVRVSFVNADALGRGARYRHALLVQPSGNASYRPLRGLHAGGIAWYGRWLYVVDTTGGLRVFDVERMLQVSTKGDAIGCTASGSCTAAGYRYVLPQVAEYRQPAGSSLRFSYLSLDRGTTPDSLVTGEYRDRKSGGRLVRWRLDASTGRLATDGAGRAPAWTAFTMGMTNVQGALSAGGRFLVSASAGRSTPGTLFSAPIGKASRSYAWGVGAEDLTCWPASQRVFGLTEHPGKRVVFAVRQSSVR
jgi:hypothetical protein